MLFETKKRKRKMWTKKCYLERNISYDVHLLWRVCGRREECTGCWWGNLRERGHWGDPDVDGRIILRWIFRNLEWGVGDWMELVQDRGRWRALVSTVRNLRVP
jgi:hypothetical protein